MVHQINFAERGVGNFHGAERLGGNFRKQAQRANGGFGLRPLHAQQTVMRRGVHDLHVVGDNIFFQPRRNFFGQARLKIQQQFVGERKNIQVAFHFAFGGGDGGVTAFAGAEFFHVVRHLPVQKSRAVGADEAKARTKA